MQLELFKKKLSSWFFWFWVQNWRVSFLMIFLIIWLGVLSLISIPKESTPDINFGIINVTTVYLGVSPTDMDELITEKIEQNIKDVDGIKKITSSSRVGVSSITIELENDANIKDVLVDIKDEVDKTALPSDAEDPLVTEISSDNEAMFSVILYWDKDSISPVLLKQKARVIKDALTNEWAITSIDIEWWDAFAIELIVDRAKMEQMWISLNQVISTIRAFNQNIPLWNYTVGNLDYDFRIQGELISEFDLLKLPLIGAQSEILLQDIATLNYSYEDESVRTFWGFEESGFYSQTLVFNKELWADIFSSSSDAKEWFEELMETQQFADLSFAYTMDMSETIKEDYAVLANSWVQTLLFVFVCLVFFVWLKESFIATLAIPLAFMITFIYLNNTWSSLNFMTNFSLVLTLGIAIDTTIVIIEGASEKMKLWYNPKSAILLAVRDFYKPLIAGTATTLVVFIPMMVLPWIIGKFLAFIPITVFVTLVAALFISLTLNSALFYKLSKKKKVFHREPTVEKFLTVEDRELLEIEREWKTEVDDSHMSLRQRILEWLNNRYEWVLRKFLSNRFTRRVSVIVPFLILIYTFTFNIGFTLFPQSDNSTFGITVTKQSWTITEVTSEFIPFIENVLTGYPEIKQFTTSVDDNIIRVNVDLLEKQERKKANQRDVFAVESAVLSDLQVLEQQWLKVASLVEWWGPPAAKPVWLKLIATDASQFSDLLSVANDFEEYLRSVDWTKNVTVSSQETPWQFVFSFDQNKLRSLWLTPNSLVWEISSSINGANAGSIKIQWDDRDIEVIYDDFADIISPSTIESLRIVTPAWPLILWEIMRYSIENAVGEISREDTNILVRVDADLADWFNGRWPELQSAYESRAWSYDLPEGISFEAAWETQENADLIFAAWQWLFISLFVIFGILVLVFNSYRKPAIILYSVICALLWVNIGLALTWNPYSMAFAIWFIALTGIVVNDAIIFVDRIMQNISHKVDTFEAIIEAWRSRLQPIILTTLTTLLWVLPISLQDKFWEWLWFTMIFGLFAGSAMTLFVIPSLYYIVFVKKNKKAQELQK